MKDASDNWHALEITQVVQRLSSDLHRGLGADEAAQRLQQYGRNAFPQGRRRTLPAMFLDQFKDFLVLILLAAGIVSLLVGEPLDAGVILAILLLNAALGVGQEHKASRELEALKKMAVPYVEVIRAAQTQEIQSEELAPGDLVILREGDFIPADMRLVESSNLLVDEASLTGESEPVAKQVAPLPPDTDLPDRKDMAYAGTHVSYGRGRGLVVATGPRRQVGQIAELLSREEQVQTPLQRNLAGLGKLLGGTALAICACVFVAGIIDDPSRQNIFRMFMVAVSLAVAAVPEGLPAVVTIVLALGVRDMSRRHALVRKLPAVETLGSATVICSDKTGTLTQNRMTIQQVYGSAELDNRRPGGAESAGELLLKIAVLCNDSRVEGDDPAHRFGDPTELALVDYALKQGHDVERWRRQYPRLDEIPFSSDRKMMTTLNCLDGRRLALVKGAPDVLLEHCGRYDGPDGPRDLDPAKRQEIYRTLERMTNDALRVLAMAWKDMHGREALSEQDERELVFVGLMGMIDPPRQEVKEALREASSAGIGTIMVTGDNLLTAQAIGRQLGLMKEGDEAVTGRQLEQISDEELRDRVDRIRIFARVWPQQKLRIVEALQARGQVVAVTGDGVNDAPALKKAQIGVAMGIAGTDVAKEASDVILTDDNFATIVAAIEQGRVIFDNIRKFVVYLLACNLGEVFAIFVPILMGLKSPLAAVQILLVNLVTDGLPALALGIDAPEPDVMRRRPRDPAVGIVSRYHLGVIGFNSVFTTLSVLASYLLGIWMEGDWQEHKAGMTMAFVTLAIGELWRALSFRSERWNVWQIDPRTNLKLLGALGLSGAIVVLTILAPGMRELFGNQPLTAAEWAVAMGCSLIPFVAYETWKFVRRQLGKA
jgi:Ca2+-transporting ATPase